jgi:hypothetical protein
VRDEVVLNVNAVGPCPSRTIFRWNCLLIVAVENGVFVFLLCVKKLDRAVDVNLVVGNERNEIL